MWAQRGLFGAMVAGALALGACSAGPSSPAPPADGGEFGPAPDVLVQILESGRHAEISPEQAAVLERAERSGEMSFEELDSLRPAMVACVEAAGLSVLVYEPTDYFPGVPVPTILVAEVPNASTEESQRAGDIATACQNRHMAYAMQFYTHQPSSIEKYEQSLLGNVDEIRACLTAYGIELPVDPTANEIVGALSQATPTGEPGRPSCYHGTTLVRW